MVLSDDLDTSLEETLGDAGLPAEVAEQIQRYYDAHADPHSYYSADAVLDDLVRVLDQGGFIE